MRRTPFLASAFLDEIIRGERSGEARGFEDGSRVIYSDAGGGGWRVLFPGQTDKRERIEAP